MSTKQSNAKLDITLKAMIEIERELSFPFFITLLAVARHPGLSVNEIADIIETPQQSASRYVAFLQGRYEITGKDYHKKPLLTLEINTDDPRRRAIFLTPAGQSLVNAYLTNLYKTGGTNG